MKTIDVKIWPHWYDMVITRQMEFGIRQNDRDYQPGDALREHRFDPTTKEMTGEVAVSRITCVLADLPGLTPGYVAIGKFFTHIEGPQKPPENPEF
jgi:hypothetical protein